MTSTPLMCLSWSGSGLCVHSSKDVGRTQTSPRHTGYLGSKNLRSAGKIRPESMKSFRRQKSAMPGRIELLSAPTAYALSMNFASILAEPRKTRCRSGKPTAGVLRGQPSRGNGTRAFIEAAEPWIFRQASENATLESIAKASRYITACNPDFQSVFV